MTIFIRQRPCRTRALTQIIHVVKLGFKLLIPLCITWLQQFGKEDGVVVESVALI